MESPAKNIAYLIYKFYKSTNKYDYNETIERAFLFVKNKREWVQNFKKNIVSFPNMNSKSIDRLYKAAYLLPIDRNSVYLISHILYFDINYKVEFMNRLCKNNPDFKREIGAYSYHGCEAEFGMDINLSVLYKFYHNAVKHPEQKYYLVCQEWQKKLYQQVMPENVKYHIINILPKII